LKSLFTHFFFLMLVILTLNNIAYTQWSPDSTVNNPICTANDNQYYPEIIGDGQGGAIIVWEDRRSGTKYDIYSQWINSSGILQWTADGILICGATEDQANPQLVSDGTGGTIYVWQDTRNGNVDIYSQRINSAGTVQWLADGVPICTMTNQQSSPQIVSDDSGGAIITWVDNRSGGFGYSDIYAQRINADGDILWNTNGVIICSEVNNQAFPLIIRDGNNGAIIVWEDERSGPKDIYAQRISKDGTVLWASNGVEVCTEANDQNNHQISSDENGGAFIIWQDYRNAIDRDIFAQRINSDGLLQWSTVGVPVCTATNHQFWPQIVSDENGGAFCTWEDYRNSGIYADIFTQKIDPNGNLIWTVDGEPICTVDKNQHDPAIISDKSSGAIIAWADHRKGTQDDIYAQRIDSSGNVLWSLNGVPISIAQNDQSSPLIINSNNGGAIVAWDDRRSSTSDVYSSLVNANGILGGDPVYVSIDYQLPSTFEVFQNYPNPFNPSTRIKYQVSSNSQVSLKVYDVLGNEVATLINEFKPVGRYEFEFNASQLSSGIYFYKLQAGSFIQTRKMVLVK